MQRSTTPLTGPSAASERWAQRGKRGKAMENSLTASELVHHASPPFSEPITSLPVSPNCTKNAEQTPAVNARIEACTITTPRCPYAEWATPRYVQESDSIAVLTSSHEAVADSTATARRRMVPRTKPHWEKKKGMDTMPAPSVVLLRFRTLDANVAFTSPAARAAAAMRPISHLDSPTAPSAPSEVLTLPFVRGSPIAGFRATRTSPSSALFCSSRSYACIDSAFDAMTPTRVVGGVACWHLHSCRIA
mmetsp:Transcript_12450/g.33867  ORF Transcript_12450/g.33867 Transcript_12450/m.33867 type:complete len:248 (+) Transcript_12450:1021-1764(+)